MEFFSFQLERFNAFNRLFQSDRPLLQNLKIEVEGLLKAIARDFMKLAIVKTKAKVIWIRQTSNNTSLDVSWNGSLGVP
jgi:hypothetical protein